MDIAGSARKHGIADADVLHAWRNVYAAAEQEYDGEIRIIAVGLARNGAFLELVLVPADEPTRIIHADNARQTFLSRLQPEAMTMAKTTAHDEATATEAWLDNLDASKLDFRDATHIRRIIAANEGVTAAESRLREAVADARAAGDSWVMIGAALGVTRQAAQQRFGAR